MAYEIIADNEVDPGSPITHSLIRRLRDNPYTVVPDVATDGSLGVKSRVAAGSSINAAINTVWDNQPGSYLSLLNTDPLTADTGAFPVCPRNGAFNAGLSARFSLGLVAAIQPTLMFGTYVYWDSSHANQYVVRAHCSVIFDGQTPTKIAIKAYKVEGVSSPVPFLTGGSPVLTGAMAATDYYELDIGAGFILLLKHVEGSRECKIEASATVDLDVAYINLRLTRNDAIYSHPEGGPGTTTLMNYSTTQYSITDTQLVKA